MLWVTVTTAFTGRRGPSHHRSIAVPRKRKLPRMSIRITMRLQLRIALSRRHRPSQLPIAPLRSQSRLRQPHPLAATPRTNDGNDDSFAEVVNRQQQQQRLRQSKIKAKNKAKTTATIPPRKKWYHPRHYSSTKTTMKKMHRRYHPRNFPPFYPTQKKKKKSWTTNLLLSKVVEQRVMVAAVPPTIPIILRILQQCWTIILTILIPYPLTIPRKLTIRPHRRRPR
mmetsp:Transcript_2241/g.4825  ORF Transcript_2241/g.4825 Transcript_2241/m.4825 type:complete len:225 (+) Transcript_2241:84-758(+)